MSKVFLMVVHRIDLGDGVDDITTVVHNRAFVSPEVRADAARRFIDTLHEGVDLEQVPPFFLDEVKDCLADMKFARSSGDLTYELLCCQGAFGCAVEFQDIDIELEELVGEVVQVDNS